VVAEEQDQMLLELAAQVAVEMLVLETHLELKAEMV
jgi:hypothetical protein